MPEAIYCKHRGYLISFDYGAEMWRLSVNGVCLDSKSLKEVVKQLDRWLNNPGCGSAEVKAWWWKGLGMESPERVTVVKQVNRTTVAVKQTDGTTANAYSNELYVMNPANDAIMAEIPPLEAARDEVEDKLGRLMGQLVKWHPDIS